MNQFYYKDLSTKTPFEALPQTALVAPVRPSAVPSVFQTGRSAISTQDTSRESLANNGHISQFSCYTTGCVHGQPVYPLLDTGSSSNLVSEELAEELTVT